MSSGRFDAIVLAGGRGSRLGGVDKAAMRLRDERMVDRSAGAARAVGAERIVIVGPDRAEVKGAIRVREDPPFSGPLAALAAGLRRLDRCAAEEQLCAAEERPSAVEWVLLLACDLVDPASVCGSLAAGFERLLTDSGLRDGVLLEDPDARPQWLAGVYRKTALRAGLDAAGGALDDRPLRLAFSEAELARLPAPAEVTADIDTPEDLERAERSGPAAAKERS